MVERGTQTAGKPTAAFGGKQWLPKALQHLMQIPVVDAVDAVVKFSQEYVGPTEKFNGHRAGSTAKQVTPHLLAGKCLRCQQLVASIHAHAEIHP